MKGEVQTLFQNKGFTHASVVKGLLLLFKNKQLLLSPEINNLKARNGTKN
jgi:hypothetical protein